MFSGPAPDTMQSHKLWGEGWQSVFKQPSPTPSVMWEPLICPVYFRPCGEGSGLVHTAVYTQHSCNV